MYVRGGWPLAVAIAPKKPNGRQQARVETAATTAAAGSRPFRRGQGWVERLNRDLLAEVPAAKLLPSIEVGPDGPKFPPMSLEDYESDLRSARKAPAGVVLYHLELLLDDPAKQAITKRIIGGR